MSRRVFLKQVLAAMAGGYLSSIPLSGSAQNKPIIMGVFPRRNTKTTYRMFWPMAAYLAGELGIQVKLETEKNFMTFWKNVENRKYDLVHFNQYHYVVAHKHFGYNAILMNEEQSRSTISGAIVVRKDSGIKSAMDLKGKTIVFGGGPRAMQSYIMAKWLLQQDGLTEDMYTTKFARNPPNAIIMTYNKQADAAGTGDAVLRMNVVEKNINTSELEFLALSQPDAHLPWATSESLSPMLSDQIRNILSELHTDPFGRHVLKRAELTRLLPAIDSDYDQARTIIKDIYGEDLGVNSLK